MNRCHASCCLFRSRRCLVSSHSAPYFPFEEDSTLRDDLQQREVKIIRLQIATSKI